MLTADDVRTMHMPSFDSMYGRRFFAYDPFHICCIGGACYAPWLHHRFPRT